LKVAKSIDIHILARKKKEKKKRKKEKAVKVGCFAIRSFFSFLFFFQNTNAECTSRVVSSRVFYSNRRTQ
jgi:hypothetical protein